MIATTISRTPEDHGRESTSLRRLAFIARSRSLEHDRAHRVRVRGRMPPSLGCDADAPKTPPKMFETRSQAWQEVGPAASDQPARGQARARGGAACWCRCSSASWCSTTTASSLLGTTSRAGTATRRHVLEPALETPITVATVIVAGDPRLGDRARRRPRPRARRCSGAWTRRRPGTVGFLIRLATIVRRAARGAARGRHRSAHARPRRRLHGGDLRSRRPADARQPDRRHGAAERAPVPRRRARAPAGRPAGRPDRGDGQLAGPALHDVRHRRRLDHGAQQRRAERRGAAAARARGGQPARAAARRDDARATCRRCSSSSLQTPLRDAPRITLEELDGEEVVVRIAATPRVASRGASAGQRAARDRLARDALRRARRRRSAGTACEPLSQHAEQLELDAAARARRRRGSAAPRPPPGSPPASIGDERQEQLVDEALRRAARGPGGGRPRTAALRTSKRSRSSASAARQVELPVARRRARTRRCAALAGRLAARGGQDHDARRRLGEQRDVRRQRRGCPETMHASGSSREPALAPQRAARPRRG